MVARVLIVLWVSALLAGCGSLQVLGSSPEGAACDGPTDPSLKDYLARVEKAWRESERADLLAFAPGDATRAALERDQTGALLRDYRTAFAAGRPRPFAGAIPSLEDTLSRQKALEGGVAVAALGTLSPVTVSLPMLVAPPAAAQRSALRLRVHLARIVPPAVDAVDRLERRTANGGPQVIQTVQGKDEFLSALAEAAQTGGDEALLWQSLAETVFLSGLSIERFGAMGPVAQAEHVAAIRSRVAEIRFAQVLRQYLGAYFRGGRIFQAKLKMEDIEREVEARLALLNPKPPPTQLAAIKAALMESLVKVCKDGKDPGCLLTSPLGDAVLTLRNGSTLAFSGITLSLGYDSRVVTTWDYPKSSEFAPQLVRVAIEALFDSLVRHPPGVPTSLACTKRLFRTVDPALPLDQQAPECLSQDVVDAVKGLQDAVGDVDEWAARADSATTTGIGMFIRGGYWAALNNETVARSVENLGGVVARKAAEHVAWRRTVELGCRIGKPPLLLQVVGG